MSFYTIHILIWQICTVQYYLSDGLYQKGSFRSYCDATKENTKIKKPVFTSKQATQHLTFTLGFEQTKGSCHWDYT